MSSQKATGKQETTPANQMQTAGRMTLGAYAKITSADAVFLEEGEQLNIQPSIALEQKGDDNIITAEFKTPDGKVEKARRRISKAMLGLLAERVEKGIIGWHVAEKRQGEKGQYFDFSPIGA